jgi:hypothetical protein
MTICCLLLPVMMSHNSAQAGEPAQAHESQKYRTIGTIAGAGGGYALGVFAGLAAFDDAVNSTRKVWTTALLSAAGGAVGGYFLGRAIDRSSSKSGPAPIRTPLRQDRLERSVTEARLRLMGRTDPAPRLPRAGASGHLRPVFPPPEIRHRPLDGPYIRFWVSPYNSSPFFMMRQSSRWSARSAS